MAAEQTRTLEGKVAVVTGAGRGLGRAIALAYARHGANLVLAARSEDELNTARADVEALGAAAIAVPTDVAREADVRHLIASAVERFGRLDVLVNNAGVGQGIAGHRVETLLDVDPTTWDIMMAVNVRGPYLSMRAALPTMLRQGRGAIVNISSAFAQQFNPGTEPYGASKAALNHLTFTVAAEFRERGIRANVLHPGGAVDTAIFTPHAPPLDPAALRPPEIIGAAAVWLASDDAADVTGQVIDCRAWNAANGLAE